MKTFFFVTVLGLVTCVPSWAGSKSMMDIPTDTPPDWAFEFGVAVITENSIGDIFNGDITIGDGPAGGEIYQLKATKTLDIMSWHIGGGVYHPHLEMPLCLEIVDENARSPFLDYNAALQLRWVDFPWNSYVKTSFAVGLGLSYSSRIYAMDYERHPGEDRSHLKFNLPIEIAFALPGQNNETLRFYITHQSGGFHVFDKGGVNSLGIAFSRTF